MAPSREPSTDPVTGTTLDVESSSDASRAAAHRPLRRLEDLARRGLITTGALDPLRRVAAAFGVAITEQMAALIDPEDSSDPIARQFVPSRDELLIAREDRTDPIGDKAFSPLPGIVHRHADRVLLKPLLTCPVHCRFCFRRDTIGTHPMLLSNAQLAAALDYIAADPRIWEVILTGGDPLMLSPRRLAAIIGRLDAIQHVDVIRLHTRVPAVEPDRVSAELVRVLQSRTARFVVLHVNHARELTRAASDACLRLIDSGTPLLSQTVLLKGVNDSTEALEQLFRALVKRRIKPYYLHHPDLVRGTQHFRPSIAEGQRLVQELRRNASGLCQPTYVLDIPGGHGKVPVGPSFIDHTAAPTQLKDPQGLLHPYPPSDPSQTSKA